jgi:hypothetical protein
MNNKEQRVLGRILAVEELHSVSGAAPTTPCRDLITAPGSDTRQSEYCVQTTPSEDSGTVADRTGPLWDPAS